MTSSIKKVKLGLSTDIDVLFMMEKGMGDRIFHAIYQYVKANSKYIKDYDKNKEA